MKYFAMFSLLVFLIIVAIGFALHEQNAVSVAAARAQEAQAQALAAEAQASAAVENVEETLSFLSPLCGNLLIIGAMVVGALLLAIGIFGRPAGRE